VCDTAIPALCDTATVTITVNPQNDPPTAGDDTDTTPEDTPITVTVLTNDTDPDGDPLNVASATDPANGTVAVNGNTTITYTPDLDWSGIDTFTYQVCDNGGIPLCDTATVTITVTPQNDPPTAGDDTDTTAEDIPITVDVLTNDTDVDGPLDPTTVTVTVNPTNGTITGINPTTGEVTYTPNPNFWGIDTFTYQVCDTAIPALCDTATVTITVNPQNDPPTAGDDTDTTPEDTPITITVLTNDTDPDGDPLNVASATDPANGTVVVNGNTTITYTPDLDWSGIDTFTYQVCDNGGIPLCDTATVTITVTPQNDPPTAGDDTDTTLQDTPLVVPAPGVLTNDTDPEGDPLTVTSNTDPTNGSVTVNADGSYTYTPNPAYAGPDQFTYTITDGNGGTDTATVTILVAGSGGNNAPVANGDGTTTDRETPVVIDVLVNDTDPDGDVLTVISTTAPANGSTVINANGTLTYTPAAGFIGTDTFTYTITDGQGGNATATVTVIVEPVNNPPAFTDEPHNTYQTVAIGGAVKALTGGDPDDDPHIYVLSAGAFPPGVSLNPDGTFSGSPTTVGTFTTTITICDIHGLCSIGVLTILVQAQLPRTGIDSDLLAIYGLLLAFLGSLLVAGSRRRRPEETR
jgi:LPXTG-motif cell wall-anchored protein